MAAVTGAAPAIVDLRDVAIAYGDQPAVLRGFTAQIPKGSFTAIVGPSGVGKSTLLRVLAGLMPAAAGTAAVRAGRDPARRPVAMVFQEARLLPWRRIAANVAFGLEGLSLSRAERERRIADALRLVGLSDYAGRWPRELSGGQRQRIGIARALAVEPELLLMDEPFAALDAITRQGLQDELLRIWRETAKTVLFVTHDLDEAVYLADRVILLGGKPAGIVQDMALDLPRPRRREGPDLAEAAGRIRSALSEAYIGGEGI
ncbi:MAG TPA: ABC transporter ATP-binding protein [Alphaproteobacteria bacterium]|nr:ABC transporter ATP-binding protein [Alphaproteobacteria bacterium]